MQNVVYIIDNSGVGPVLGYDPKRYEKLESSLKKSGYRKATMEELKKFKNIEQAPAKPVKLKSDPVEEPKLHE